MPELKARHSEQTYMPKEHLRAINGREWAIHADDTLFVGGKATLCAQWPHSDPPPVGEYHMGIQRSYSDEADLQATVQSIVDEKKRRYSLEIQQLTEELAKIGDVDPIRIEEINIRLKELRQAGVWAWCHRKVVLFGSDSDAIQGQRIFGYADEVFIKYFKGGKKAVTDLNKEVEPMLMRPFGNNTGEIWHDWKILE